MRARPVRWRPRTRPRRWLLVFALFLLAGLACRGAQAGVVLLEEAEPVREAAEASGLFTVLAASGVSAHAAVDGAASFAAGAAAGARIIFQRRRKDEEDKGGLLGFALRPALTHASCSARDAAAQARALELLKPDGAEKMPEGTVADLPLFTPPAKEEFDLFSLKGFFRAVTCKGKPGRFPTVLLQGDPAVLERLRRGEATRGNCSHLTMTHSRTAGARVYTCEHAPERTRAAQRACAAAAAAAAAEEATQQRGTKGNRRGAAKLRATGVKGACCACAMRHLRLTVPCAGCCLMRFTVTPTESGCVLRVLGVEHTGHPDTGKPPRHVAQWCHQLIRETFYEREGVTVGEVRNAVQQEALTRGLKRQNASMSRAELEEIYLKEGCVEYGVREYLIKDEQIAHIIKQLNNDTSQLLPDEAESIAKWAEQHPHDVLMYRPGVDTPAGREEDVRHAAALCSTGQVLLHPVEQSSAQ